MKRAPGIYMILCKPTGEKYVGSTVSIARRFHEHVYDLRHDLHDNYRLQAEWVKHDESDFEWTVLEWLDNTEHLVEREQYWMDTLKPELNIALSAESPALGLKHSPEVVERQRQSRRRYVQKLTPERREELRQLTIVGRREWWAGLTEEERLAHIRKISNPHTEETKRILSEKSTTNNPRNWLGKHRSEETKQKISEALTGRVDPEVAERRVEWAAGAEARELERRRKISEARSGRKLSAETKAKLREIALAQNDDPDYKSKHAAGLKAAMSTPEMRQKLSDAHKGKKLTQAHRKHLGQAGRGKTRSPETKARMSAAKREWWAKRKAQQSS